jgi:hypothetical protein
MLGRRKFAIALAGLILVGAALAMLLFSKTEPLTLQGAVTRQDADARKQLPIAGVQITAANGVVAAVSRSDAAGFFRLRLPPGIKPGQSVVLQFRHPGYQELDLTETVARKLYLARMTPVPSTLPVSPAGPLVPISNVSVRYSSNNTTNVNIGSVVKTLEIANTGDVPCPGGSPCSPDGRWKAAIGSDLLDAGEGNEFRNTRVSCIAGPCPFTKIESAQLSHNGREFRVSIRNWSDTTTFLLEAEVYHPMASAVLRQSVPVIFGQTLNFSLPADAEGSSIVAEVGKESIIFPLGPDLCLSWANCTVRLNPDQSRAFRCELKPGYGFK